MLQMSSIGLLEPLKVEKAAFAAKPAFSSMNLQLLAE